MDRRGAVLTPPAATETASLGCWAATILFPILPLREAPASPRGATAWTMMTQEKRCFRGDSLRYSPFKRIVVLVRKSQDRRPRG